MEIYGPGVYRHLDWFVAEAKAYVDASPEAVSVMENRLVIAARKGNELLRLATLGRGLTLVHPQTGQKMPIDAGAEVVPQDQLDAIDQIAFYLGWMSHKHSNRKILANALVIDQNRWPTRGFVNLARATGRVWAAKSRDDKVLLQARECARVYEWFAQLHQDYPFLTPLRAA